MTGFKIGKTEALTSCDSLVFNVFPVEDLGVDCSHVRLRLGIPICTMDGESD